MSKNMSMNVVSLLSTLEKRHDMGELDSLHWDVLIAVMEAQRASKSMTNQNLVDCKFTSRSSTYRKIADMRKLGILAEKWDKGICNLELGPKAHAFFEEAATALKSLALSE
jgi:hypothetical protein